MVSIQLMAGVITIGVLVLCTIAGMDPVHGSIGGFATWVAYSLTFVWASSKLEEDVVEKKTKVEVRKVTNPVDKKMRALLDELQEVLGVKQDSKLKSAIKRLSESSRFSQETVEPNSQLDEKLKADLASERSKRESAESRLTAVEKENQARVSNLESEVARLSDELQQAQNSSKGTQVGRDWALKQAEESRTQVNQLSKELQSRDAQLEEKVELLEQKGVEISNARAEIEKLKTNSSAAVTRLSQQLQEVKNSLDTARSELQARTEDVQKGQGRIDDLSLELQRVSAAKDSYQAELKRISSELEGVKGELQNQEQKAAGLLEELEIAKANVGTKADKDALLALERVGLAWKFLEQNMAVVEQMSETLDGFEQFLFLLDPEASQSDWANQC